MAFLRQYVAPFFIFLVFLIALVAVSSRIFLPGDMAAPAPVEAVNPQRGQGSSASAVADLPPALSVLIKGLPDDPALSTQL